MQEIATRLSISDLENWSLQNRDLMKTWRSFVQFSAKAFLRILKDSWTLKPLKLNKGINLGITNHEENCPGLKNHIFNSCVRCIDWLYICFTCVRCDISSINKRSTRVVATFKNHICDVITLVICLRCYVIKAPSVQTYFVYHVQPSSTNIGLFLTALSH